MPVSPRDLRTVLTSEGSRPDRPAGYSRTKKRRRPETGAAPRGTFSGTDYLVGTVEIVCRIRLAIL